MNEEKRKYLDYIFKQDKTFLLIPIFLKNYFKSYTIPILLRRLYLESLKHPEGEWFIYQKHKIVEEELLPITRVISNLKILKEKDLVDTKIEQCPPVTFYKLNYENLYTFLTNEIKNPHNQGIRVRERYSGKSIVRSRL